MLASSRSGGEARLEHVRGWDGVVERHGDGAVDGEV